MGLNELLVILMFLTFIGLLFTGLPVAYVLAGVGILFAAIGYISDLYFGTFTGLDFMLLGLLVNRIYKIMDNWILVALPMFIFMGNLLDRSGIAERLMASVQHFFGNVNGGLAITVVCIGIVLAASTGIIGASVVLLATMSLTTMSRQGYDMPLALGTIASAGTLGILIPPSIMLVIMADQIGLSVGDLFMAAVFPGFLLGALYVFYLLIVGKLRPAKLPLSSTAEPISLSIAARALLDIAPVCVLILVVLGSIFTGTATPTEAAGIGALGAMLLTLINGRMRMPVLRDALLETYKTSAYIFALLIGATCFALVLRVLGGDEFIASLLHGLPFGDYGIVFFILFLVFLLGFLLDWIEITLIVLPLLVPVVAALGLEVNGFGNLDNPTLVWFVMLVAMVLQTSFLTPPVGFALFYLKGVCPPEVSLQDIYKGVAPFIVLQLIGLALILTWPALVTWLPSQAY